MECVFGLFDDLPNGETHPLQIDIFEDENDIQQKVKDLNTNIYQPRKDGTMLHCAIKGSDQARLNALLNTYQADLQKVCNHINLRYNINSDIHLKKSILVACGVEQCQKVKSLESHIAEDKLEQSLIVLLQTPVGNEEVALIHPTIENSAMFCDVIKSLLSNGVLNLNYSGLEDKEKTFVETAAACGKIALIKRLCELGASISIPNHNPLLSAIQHNQTEVIRWLLTDHFHSYDCTARDSNQDNALILAMRKCNVQMFDFILEKMISYRQIYYKETETDAFNKIFRYENEEYHSLSIFTCFRKGPIQKKVEECILRYQLDLFYRWQCVTIIVDMICRGICLDYCFEGIRQHPKLLGIVEYGDTTLLHKMINWGHIEFLNEMYLQHPEVKSYFENDFAFQSLRIAIIDEKHNAIDFIMNNHSEYLYKNLDKLKEHVICSKCYSLNFLQNGSTLLRELFPQHHDDIEKSRLEALTSYRVWGMEYSFINPKVDLSGPMDIDNLPGPINSIRGIKGETLLHFAVDKEKCDLVISLLEAGCDFDTLDDEGNHAIHYVNNIEMLNLLIDKHPEGTNIIHRLNYKGYSVLHRICALRMHENRLIELLQRVIACGADVNQLTGNGESVVFLIGCWNVFDVLLKHNIKLDVISADGSTAIEQHLNNRNVCMVRVLWPLVREQKAFKDRAHKYLDPMMYRNRDFFSVDYQSMLEKYPDTTKLIFDSIFNNSREEASRLFTKACGSAQNYVAGKFLEYDYDLDYNYADDDGYTPIIGLLSYMEENNFHLVKRLLEKNVDLELKNNWGRNALLCLINNFTSAKWYGHGIETVRMLIAHGAQVNVTDSEGNTPLHMAYRKCEWELVALLLQHGANKDSKNECGKTPFQMVSKIAQELFQFLK